MYIYIYIYTYIERKGIRVLGQDPRARAQGSKFRHWRAYRLVYIYILRFLGVKMLSLRNMTHVLPCGKPLGREPYLRRATRGNTCVNMCIYIYIYLLYIHIIYI